MIDEERKKTDSNVIHPIAGYDKEIYVKPTVKNPNIIVGDFTCIVDSEFENHFDEIIGHESEIESRLIDADCTMDVLKADNKSIIDGFQNVGEQIVLIDSDYKQTIAKMPD